MTDDIYSMTKAGFHEAIRQAQELAWDEAYMLGFADCRVGAAPTRPNPHKEKK